MLFMVTVKHARNLAHNPRAKVTDCCPARPDSRCTDATGEHHTLLVEAPDVDRVRGYFDRIHVTRIETVREAITIPA